jgi:hypothetical protein
MEKRLVVTKNRIEATFTRGCSVTTAIAFHVVMGKWSVATSMCMPSDIEEAKAVKECFDIAFDALSSMNT